MQKKQYISSKISFGFCKSEIDDLPIDTCKTFPHNKENNNVEDNQMSFVGLQLNQKERKVIAFADSKGSRIDEKGNYFFDEKRGNVNKIFKTEEFIAVTFGGNEFQNINGHIFPIEQLVEKYANEGIGNVLEHIQDYYGDDDKTPHIFFLYARKGSNYCEQAEISAKGISLTKVQIVQRNTFIGGDTFYNNLFKEHVSLNDCSTDEIKEKIETVIEFKDKLDSYNSVGKPVQVIEWDWGEALFCNSTAIS